MRSLEQWELVARIERGMLLERADRITRRGELPAPRLGFVAWPARLWSLFARPRQLLPATEYTATAGKRAARIAAGGATCPHLRRSLHTGGTADPARRRAKISTH